MVVIYLFNSLAKTVDYFENTLKPLTEIILLSLHIISNH